MQNWLINSDVSLHTGFYTINSFQRFHCLLDIFTQVSDQSGVLILSSFKDYLKEALALPAMVLEAPTFAYTDELVSTIFNGVMYRLRKYMPLILFKIMQVSWFADQ